MNYLPYCGWFFIGGQTTAETAAYVCSWGLLSDIGTAVQLFAPLVMYYRRMLRG